MAKFHCKICHQDVSLGKIDSANVKDHNDFTCINCVTVIYSKDYEPGKVTVFAPLGTKEGGTALGDRIMTQLVFDEYIKDNPDEQVTILDTSNDSLKWIAELKPDKIFVSEFDAANKEILLEHRNAIPYRMTNEICNYARDRIYPRNPFKPKYVFHKDYKYIVLHIRNITKPTDRNWTPDGYMDIKKNMPVDEAMGLIETCVDIGLPIVIIGNDKSFLNEPWVHIGSVIDLRYQLTLNQIAGIMKNAQLFIGRDSGHVHLAAACGCNIIAYNFINEKWHPKMKPSKYTAFNRDVEFQEVLKSIREYFE